MNNKKLEVIKRQMEENIETLREFHKLQMEILENVISLSDIDEVDNMITEVSDEVNFSTFASEIMQKEKDNFKKLMDLAWEIKFSEHKAREEAEREKGNGTVFDSKSFIDEMEDIDGVDDSFLDYEDYEEYHEQMTERELRGGL